MDKSRKKELRDQFKSRRVTGGIYRIINTETGKFYLQCTDDFKATHNWFESCRMFGHCSLPPIQEDWKKYGMDAFQIEELDHLEKPEEQTHAEFMADLRVLRDMWEEKLPRDNRY